MLVLQTFPQLGQHEGDIAQGWAAVLRLPGMTEASVLPLDNLEVS